LFNSKEDENFNRRNTLSILRINPLKFGGGLKFESDAEIGQKGAFCKGLKIYSTYIDTQPGFTIKREM